MVNKLHLGDGVYPVGLLFVLSFILYSAVMYMNLGPEIADDGAFFLRYADNIVQGEFWVWNLGEEPVWGASAPLYPLLVAVPIIFGVSSVTSLIWTGITLSAFSFSFVCSFLYKKLGAFSAICFLLFTLTDVHLMYFSASGLESPLVFLLFALAIYCIIEQKPEMAIGVLASMLAIHKLDLLPAAGLLLLCLWIKNKQFPLKATLVTIALCTIWYGFAWGYFGAPVPNSFITKSLYQNDFPKSIDWTWFSSLVLLHGMHLVFFCLALVLVLTRRYLLCLLFFGGVVFTHIVAYSIKYPFEPYDWYSMPSVFSLAVLAALGANVVKEFLSVKIGYYSWALGLSLLAVFTLFSVKKFNQNMLGIHAFVSHQERDRAEAGRWVDKNTPKEFKVYTSWGNPAYFSKRYVYDGSFLNRKFREEERDLINTFDPEILILQNNPGSTPDAPVYAATSGERYRVVKTFDKSFKTGLDYFFIVLAREDVVKDIDNITIPLDHMQFVRNTVLGSNFGILKVHGVDSLFIHPGLNSPTTFEYLVNESMDYAKLSRLGLSFAIADHVPVEAINRGGADLLVTVVDAAGKELFSGSVNHKETLEFNLLKGDVDLIKVIVDSKGSVDTDWLVMTIGG